MGLLTKEIESRIIEILPDKFDIMFDGWSKGSEHFFKIFACFPENGKCRSLLLAFAPPLQEGDLSAESLQDLIEATLCSIELGIMLYSILEIITAST